ncbi:hypothetical protein Tco_0223682 [Tanacetum coccineum]
MEVLSFSLPVLTGLVLTWILVEKMAAWGVSLLLALLSDKSCFSRSRKTTRQFFSLLRLLINVNEYLLKPAGLARFCQRDRVTKKNPYQIYHQIFPSGAKSLRMVTVGTQNGHLYQAVLTASAQNMRDGKSESAEHRRTCVAFPSDSNTSVVIFDSLE